jgi:hypothetical protein
VPSRRIVSAPVVSITSSAKEATRVGHRANFVVIRDRQAAAFYSQWAAMNCLEPLAGGPEAAAAAAEVYEPVDTLMERCWAEGGYLVDFDERRAILFGSPVPMHDPIEGIDEPFRRLPPEAAQGGLGFLRFIAPAWGGWRLVWDDRGVVAFAAHLLARGIAGVTAEGDSHPLESPCVEEYQA